MPTCYERKKILENIFHTCEQPCGPVSSSLFERSIFCFIDGFPQDFKFIFDALLEVDTNLLFLKISIFRSGESKEPWIVLSLYFGLTWTI